MSKRHPHMTTTNPAPRTEARHERDTTTRDATIEERGNGLPDVGDYVPGSDGELYRIVTRGRIQTGEVGSGRANRMRATVELASWDDVESGVEFAASAVVDDEHAR